MTKTKAPTKKLERILGWLDTHPGQHTPKEVATGAGIDPSRCASLLLYLAKHDRVRRYRNQSIRNGPGSSLYSQR